MFWNSIGNRVPTAPAVNKRNGVLNNVQALRAVAALLVVVAHLNGLLDSLGIGTNDQISAGIFGTAVAIFFAVSGFIMVHTTAGRPLTAWAFMRARLVRIAPIYWAITVALFGMAMTVPSLLQSTQANWSDLLKSLLFIPFMKSNGQIEPILFVGWTLNYEMFFYLLFSVGLMFADRLLGLLSVVATTTLIVASTFFWHPTSVPGNFYTHPVMLEFSFGMIVALVAGNLPRHAGRRAKTAMLGLIVAAVCTSIMLPYLVPHVSSVIVCGIPGTIMVFSAVILDRWGWSIRSPLWLLLGDCSYSLYLTHAFVTQVIEKVGTRLHAHGIVSLALIAVALILSSVVGISTFYTIERPLWQAARRRFIPLRIPATAV